MKIQDAPFLNDSHLTFFNRNTTNVFYHDQKCQVLIFKEIHLSKDGLNFSSILFIVHSENCYQLNWDDSSLDKLESGKKSMFQILMDLARFDKEVIEEYNNEIDALEDELYERKLHIPFVDKWFKLKKDISKIERHLQRNEQVIKDFFDVNTDQENEASTVSHFRGISESNRTTAQSLKNRLNSVYSFYETIKNDRLNKNIYYLTILSAIFLPLNLVVGFFGINTDDLFFKGHGGTYNVIKLLLLVFIISLLGVRSVKIIDQLIFRRVFKKLHFYEKLAKRLDEL